MSEPYVTVPCPHAGCEGLLRLKPSLPAGTYRCLCQTCQVRLTWSVRQPTFTRMPHARCACGADAAAEAGEGEP
jgi:hypothetical protein